MSHPPGDVSPITSGPLVIRPVEIEDAEIIVGMYQDQAVLSGLGKPTPLSLEATRSSISAIRAGWENAFLDLPLMFSITLDGAVIGFTQLKLGYSSDRALVGELTIVLVKNARKKQFGKTALSGFIDWAFEQYGVLQQVWGACVPENSASIALMTSLGMDDCGLVSANEGRPVRKFRLSRHTHG